MLGRRPFCTMQISALAILTFAILVVGSVPVCALNKRQNASIQFIEGKAICPSITIGPFDLRRRYRSMEGPFSLFNAKAGDIVASNHIEIPETMVDFVEKTHSAPGMSNSCTGSPSNISVKGLVDSGSEPRTLLWLKGVKLEVLDENNNVLPTAEFICHFNIDTNPKFRNRVFWQAETCQISRLMTLTQGQTEIMFPDGFGVPVASDEPWTIIFQAANRTTDKHRRIKHRCTVYFIKDSDLVQNMTALYWFAPFLYVNIDSKSATASREEKTNCPACIGTSLGVNAPTNFSNGTFIDHTGHRMSGHWVVPPGIHRYCTTINDDRQPGFSAKSRILHAAWSHVHPLCTSLSLYDCRDRIRKKVLTVAANTQTKHGLELTNIDYWSSKAGVLLPAKTKYELEAIYNNTTGKPQDAMASMGMFFTDSIFVRPDWVRKYEHNTNIFPNIKSENGRFQRLTRIDAAKRLLP